jgi:epoxyqueuosine reductase
MSRDDLTDRLRKALDEGGFVHRLADVVVTEELSAILVDLRRRGQVSEKLLTEYAIAVRFSSPKEVPEGRTLIVVASRSPMVKVRFHLATGPSEAVIPPTYISTVGRERCLEIMRGILEPAGFAVARARVPVKLLAVRTGLAQYGRNNVAYVRNRGSLVRLDAFCTNAPLQVEDSRPKGSWRLSCCPPCRNCHHVCPTGCIPYDGRVIEAERCLTYFNENEGEWPDWLDPKGHNALVGCMRCQELCPANRVHLRIPRVIAEFDREETEWVLRDLPVDELPEGVRAKLEALDLDGYSTVLGRNLRALTAAVD